MTNDRQSALLQTPSSGDPVLAEIVFRLVGAYHPERIYLFGSAARGEAGPDSDYDIMVVVPDQSEPERRDCDLAYRVLRGLRVAKDVLVWPRSEFEKRLHLKASFPSTILREGKLLYAA
jgi:predicted nucleotidyltransferase